MGLLPEPNLEENPHLWGGLLWHVDLPHLGFPRGGLFQKKRQPLASPGFGELHSYLPWLSLPPHWIQLPAQWNSTSEHHILHPTWSIKNMWAYVTFTIACHYMLICRLMIYMLISICQLIFSCYPFHIAEYIGWLVCKTNRSLSPYLNTSSQ